MEPTSQLDNWLPACRHASSRHQYRYLHLLHRHLNGGHHPKLILLLFLRSEQAAGSTVGFDDFQNESTRHGLKGHGRGIRTAIYWYVPGPAGTGTQP